MRAFIYSIRHVYYR